MKSLLLGTSFFALGVAYVPSGAFAQQGSAPPAHNGTEKPVISESASIPPMIRKPTADEQKQLDGLKTELDKAIEAKDWPEVERIARAFLAIESVTYGLDHPFVANDYLLIAKSFDQRDRYAESEPFYKRALAIHEKVFGPDNSYVATDLNNLAAVYRAQGRYAQAEPLYKRALAIDEKVFGPDHPYVGSDLKNLAGLYDHQGRYAEAEPLYKRALAIDEKALGPDHPNVGVDLIYLAELYRAQGRNTEAEPLYKLALTIFEKALGPDHPYVATVLNDLAVLYYTQGRYGEVEPLYQRALAIDEKALGPDNPGVATDLNDLAGLYYAQARYGEAEPLYQRAIAIDEKALGPNNPDVAADLNNLAALERAQGRYAHAEPLYQRAIAIDEKALGPDNPDVAAEINNLAELYSAQGRYAEAEPLYQRALAIWENAQGSDSPNVATALNNLAELDCLQGRYTEAEPLYQRALAIYEKALGPDHPNVAKDLNNLATLYRTLDRYTEAEPLYKRALAIDEKALGLDHPHVSIDLNNLATLYRMQGRYADAEPLYQRSLAIDEKAQGPDHADVARDLNNLALLYDEQGRYSEAEPLYQRALAIDEKARRPDHPDFATDLNNLAALYKGQGRYAEAEPLSWRAVEIAHSVRAAASGSGNSGEQGALLRARSSQGDGPEPLGYVYGEYVSIACAAAGADQSREGELQGRAFGALQDFDTSGSSAAAAMAQAQARRVAGDGPLGTLVERQQDLTGRVRGLDGQMTQALASSDETLKAQVRVDYAKAVSDLEAVDQQLHDQFPAYADLVIPKALDVTDVQSRLSADEGLLFIEPVGDDVFVFAVTKQAVSWHRLEKGAVGIDQTVKALRAQLGGEGTGLYNRQSAYDLYHQLIEPVESVFTAGHVTKLYSVAGGSLADLPLGVVMTQPKVAGVDDDSDEALATSDDWFADRYSITVLPSVSSLGAPSRDGDASQATSDGVAFIGYGDPVLTGQHGAGRGPDNQLQTTGTVVAKVEDGKLLIDPDWVRTHFAPLEGTQIELPQLARDLGADPRTSLNLAAADTETGIKDDTALANARVVAIATHGFLPTQVPGFKEPGLVFTPPKTPSFKDDGVLTASEAADLRFKADWIILSACDTATPDGTSGAQGMSSLAKGFLYAGAGALLASHWPVSDEVTAVLTSETLRLRAKGLTRAEALQQAMHNIRTGIRSDTNTKMAGYSTHWANPALWAPFSVISNNDR